MKLSAAQLCPLHRRRDCCGRKKKQASGARNFMSSFEPGVRRIRDEHHPRGYRELRSPAAMRRLVVKKVEAQEGNCILCGQPFTDMNYVTAEHMEPRSMGGARRDDHPDNIGASHLGCNLQKGSKRL